MTLVDDASARQLASDDARWLRWRGEIEAIAREVRGLVESDIRFRSSMRALEEWPEARLNVTYEWIMSLYSRDSAVQIRRMLERTNDAMSLAKLILDIQRNPLACSRDRFIDSYIVGLGSNASSSPNWRDTARQAFNDHAGGDWTHWPSALAQQDADELQQLWLSSGLERITNTRIVHHNPRDTAKLRRHDPQEAADIHAIRVKWQNTHDCVAVVERIMLRYEFLLLQAAPPTIEGLASFIDESTRKFWLGEGPDDDA